MPPGRATVLRHCAGPAGIGRGPAFGDERVLRQRVVPDRLVLDSLRCHRAACRRARRSGELVRHELVKIDAVEQTGAGPGLAQRQQRHVDGRSAPSLPSGSMSLRSISLAKPWACPARRRNHGAGMSDSCRPVCGQAPARRPTSRGRVMQQHPDPIGRGKPHHDRHQHDGAHGVADRMRLVLGLRRAPREMEVMRAH